MHRGITTNVMSLKQNAELFSICDMDFYTWRNNPELYPKHLFVYREDSRKHGEYTLLYYASILLKVRR